MISGVGPKLEALLNSLGFFTCPRSSGGLHLFRVVNLVLGPDREPQNAVQIIVFQDFSFDKVGRESVHVLSLTRKTLIPAWVVATLGLILGAMWYVA